MPFLSHLASAKINAAEKYIGDNKNFKHLVEDLVNPKKYIVAMFDAVGNWPLFQGKDNKNFKHLVEDLVNPKKYIVGTVMLFEYLGNPKKYVLGTMFDAVGNWQLFQGKPSRRQAVMAFANSHYGLST